MSIQDQQQQFFSQAFGQAQSLGQRWLDVAEKNTLASFELARTALTVRSAEDAKGFLADTAKVAREGVERVVQATQQTVQESTASLGDTFAQLRKEGENAVKNATAAGKTRR